MSTAPAFLVDLNPQTRRRRNGSHNTGGNVPLLQHRTFFNMHFEERFVVATRQRDSTDTSRI
ncbi:MAG: hypothetical protein DMG12_27290 [Acidobacteria bacterium]|nr:MAG: hypothetical protein DMG12_27290 [Acidobacteriota bacterium]